MDIDREALVAAFVVESGELLAGMEAVVMRLEAGEADEDLRQRLLRSAHTLKGNASCVAFDALGAYVHRFEDLLESLIVRRTVTAEVVTALLRVVDVLRATVEREDGSLPPGAEGVLAHAERLADAQPSIAAPELAAATYESSARDSIRVGTSKLDRMVNLTGELAIARGRVSKLLGDRAELLGTDLAEAIAEADRLDQQLQELVMKLRMVPIGPELQRFARMVRDVAIAHGKLVQLAIEGGDVEVDTAVATALRDPLTHMLRNAIDHGIEPPDAREASGKPRIGTILVRVRHSSGRIVVEVEDDGAGLDRERILDRAQALGLAGETVAGEREIDDFIFAHGLTTAAAAGDLSGRGIGMDVVRRSIESLRGTIDVHSRAGEGTRFTIRLPLTLAIIDGFAVGVGEETFIVPLDTVVECLDLPSGLDRTRGEGVINLRGEPLPFVRLRHRLGVTGGVAARESVIVVNHDEGLVGLAGDRLIGQVQTVIKPLGALDRIPGVSAAAILGSGDVALILDVPRLVRTVIDHHVQRSVA